MGFIQFETASRTVHTEGVKSSVNPVNMNLKAMRTSFCWIHFARNRGAALPRWMGAFFWTLVLTLKGLSKMKNVVLLSSLLAASAQEDFSGVSFTAEDGVIAGATTYRFFLNFDSPADALLAVSGNDDYSAFRITSETGLINNELLATRLGDVEDTNGILTGAGDSFFADWGGDTSFSPDFVVSGTGQILSSGATLLEQLDNGGVFDSNPASQLTGSVFFMQLSVAQGSQLTVEGC